MSTISISRQLKSKLIVGVVALMVAFLYAALSPVVNTTVALTQAPDSHYDRVPGPTPEPTPQEAPGVPVATPGEQTWMQLASDSYVFIHGSRRALGGAPAEVHGLADQYITAEGDLGTLVWMPTSHFTQLHKLDGRAAATLLHEIVHVADYENLFSWEEDFYALIDAQPSLVSDLIETYQDHFVLTEADAKAELLAEVVGLNYGTVGSYLTSVSEQHSDYMSRISVLVRQAQTIDGFAADMAVPLNDATELLPTEQNIVRITDFESFTTLAADNEAVAELLFNANHFWL